MRGSTTCTQGVHSPYTARALRAPLHLLALVIGLHLGMAPLGASAQSEESAARVVGTAVVGGKRVELLSDNTWRYHTFNNSEPDCVPVNSVLAFCGSILDWRPLSPQGSDFIRMFRHDDRNMAGIIFEALGADVGLDLDSYRGLILQNTAAAVALPIEEIPVVDVRDTFVDGVPSQTIIYGIEINGVAFVYLNTFVVSENASLQLISWAIGNDVSEDMEEIHGAFADAVRLDFKDGQL